MHRILSLRANPCCTSPASVCFTPPSSVTFLVECYLGFSWFELVFGISALLIAILFADNCRGCVVLPRDLHLRLGPMPMQHGHLLSEHHQTGVTNSTLFFFLRRNQYIVNECPIDRVMVEMEGYFGCPCCHPASRWRRPILQAFIAILG